jgi:hypothetical protein
MFETAASMIVLVGRTVQVRFEKVSVLCNVVDSRSQWGRTDILIEPVGGSGQQWVEKNRVVVTQHAGVR